MELSELVVYAREKYNILEQHKWLDFPGFSVLCHPDTGQWAALLMRQWDTDSGTQIEYCDLKCGQQSLREISRPYLGAPIRMRGQKWVGVAFDERTEADVVFRLFDRAVTSGEQRGFTITIEAAPSSGASDTPLPFAGSAYQPVKEVFPERLREMRRLYEYGRETMEAKARNFVRQGKFMEDYEDDYPWKGPFVCYFPTYHDMTAKQLRGYFSWRTRVRRGEYTPIPASAAYLYLYELLNGIGTSSPQETLEKMKAFETGFADAGLGDERMRQNLHHWMLELAVLSDLSPERARAYADPAMIGWDEALAVLRSPENCTDEAVFSALSRIDGGKLSASPVINAAGERGAHLFCEIWRAAAETVFPLCFGAPASRRWYPLSNAVVLWPERQEDRDFVLDAGRVYRCRRGAWHVEAYERLSFDRHRFRSFVREADLKLRRYFKTGRYLREKPEDAWADPYIEAVIEADQRDQILASRPKITIDLAGLDRIRQDALTTRDALLTEEEREELRGYQEPESAAVETALAAAWSVPVEDAMPDLPMNDMQVRLLRALLAGEPTADILREAHMMPSIAADELNETLFDEIGDVAVLCENDDLSLVEDYREDVAQLLGGTQR